MGEKNREPELLRRGKAFHRKVQASWHEEAEGDVYSEKGVTKPSGRKGRMDVFVEGGDTKALVEIKASDWDRMTEKAEGTGVVETKSTRAELVCTGPDVGV